MIKSLKRSNKETEVAAECSYLNVKSSSQNQLEGVGWSCKICTYLNEKPLALACSMCGSERH